MPDGDGGGEGGTVGPTIVALAQTASGTGSAFSPRALPTLRPTTATASGRSDDATPMVLSRRIRVHSGTPVVRRGPSA